jgi:hypothetical protein
MSCFWRLLELAGRLLLPTVAASSMNSAAAGVRLVLAFSLEPMQLVKLS